MWSSGQGTCPDVIRTCLDFQTSMTGMPAMGEFGSSTAELFTVSFAPITRQTSTSPSSSLISSCVRGPDCGRAKRASAIGASTVVRTISRTIS